ncbi:ribosomal protein S18-alanine N-acetyltransferase [Nocardioides daeguensis]|uniref:[Ribosomal protein bS18]-alanine N-acetyltransferase n=1 Tax=Nocardioides daeguensis TaxID=908359 RepID=A0ABP6W5H7_9ACTN
MAAIVALEAASFPLDPWSENLVGEGVSGSLPTVTYLVAERDGAFAGHAVLSVVDVDAELQRIAVPEELRRTGVATALLAAVRAVAAAGGAGRVLLEVREDNTAARRFYERHGFAELGRRPRYYRDGTDALVLASPVTMVP